MDSQKLDLHWHVVYTMPKCERKVAASIENLGIESFLPMQTVVRHWSDREKKLQVPLFPNYVFVKVEATRRNNVYSIKELVKFISLDKRPVTIADREILIIKQVMSGVEDISSEDYFHEGSPVRIREGQFAGLEGIIIKKTGNTRLLVRIDRLMKAFSFNISFRMVEPIGPRSYHSLVS